MMFSFFLQSARRPIYYRLTKYHSAQITKIHHPSLGNYNKFFWADLLQFNDTDVIKRLAKPLISKKRAEMEIGSILVRKGIARPGGVSCVLFMFRDREILNKSYDEIRSKLY